MSSPEGEPPVARVEPAGLADYRWLFSLNPYWILAIASLMIAVGLVVWSQRSSGTSIVIHFQHGHGLKAGDRLRHRGIEVGEVTAVRLSADYRQVAVVVDLAPTAKGLAREGSIFWIERPQVGLSRVRGLDTVVGAKYLDVAPGSPESPPQYEFQGEEHPLSVQGAQTREIVVRFEHGNGLVVGDDLRHRGIRVGEVTAVNLIQDLSRVEVRVRLEGFAARLARAGSRFWVERPQVSLSGVRGLETVVGGRYLSVVPGPPQADELSVFDGLEAPPAARSGGLEIVLTSPHRFGVEVGAPLIYRGMQVGSVVDVRLAHDSTQVETRAHVDADYRLLVCEGTRFWSTSGIGINVGLSGFQLNAESLQTIAAGGIAFATPNDPGSPVSTGHRFELDRKGEQSWLAWSPRLASGRNRLPDGSELPEPEPLALTWQVKQLGWRRRHQHTGLALLLKDGSWLGPKELFTPPPEAIDGSARIEFAGQELGFDAAQRQVVNDLAFYQTVRGSLSLSQAWPVGDVRVPGPPEDCLIVTGRGDRPIPLPASRMTLGDDSGWTIDASFTIPPEWYGSSVVAAADGKLVAILHVDAQRGNARALVIGSRQPAGVPP